MTEVHIESESIKLTNFSQSLGKILGQIGIYTIVQVIAGIILAIFTAIFTSSMFHWATSPLEIFNQFQTSLWTLIIMSIILEVIMYFFIIKLIIILKHAGNQVFLYEDKYRKSALSFSIGIILGVILIVVDIILINWLLQMIHGILINPSFQSEDLQQIPSINIGINASLNLMKVGSIVASIAGFYYLKTNFEELRIYTRNGKKIVKGFRLLVIGFSFMLLGSLLRMITDFLSFIEFIGLIVTIKGYFKTSDGLSEVFWTIRF
ncbi:MAG: hypothetical protein P8Y70_18150 [Candidatus Lokiarchaeota archaeon]